MHVAMYYLTLCATGGMSEKVPARQKYDRQVRAVKANYKDARI